MRANLFITLVVSFLAGVMLRSFVPISFFIASSLIVAAVLLIVYGIFVSRAKQAFLFASLVILGFVGCIVRYQVS